MAAFDDAHPPAGRSPGRENFLLRLFGLVKIPLIGYVRPRVVSLDDDMVVVRVPLSRRTRNHHGTMYFGALAIGADMAAGLAAMRMIAQERRHTGVDVSFVFKDVRGEFLRRPDGDVHFSCRSVREVRALVAKAYQSGAREELAVPVECTVPATTGADPVARFVLTLSLKRRG